MSGILTVMNKKIKRVKRNYKTKNSDSDVKLAVKVGYACCAAAEISGDAVISCGLPDGSRALILSDGMGKGIKAAAGSRLVVSRLRRNLKDGMPVARAIKELNRYMIDHSRECAAGEDFATVDLTIIDPAGCRAKFYKMGATKSFVVRDGRVRSISQAALPVGIIPTLRLTHISASLKAGDIIVMASDGITEADREDMEAGWLAEYLSDFVEKSPANQTEQGNNETLRHMSPRRMAAEIMQQALQRYGGREQDDLTVAVVVLYDEEKDFTDC